MCSEALAPVTCGQCIFVPVHPQLLGSGTLTTRLSQTDFRCPTCNSAMGLPVPPTKVITAPREDKLALEPTAPARTSGAGHMRAGLAEYKPPWAATPGAAGCSCSQSATLDDSAGLLCGHPNFPHGPGLEEYSPATYKSPRVPSSLVCPCSMTAVGELSSPASFTSLWKGQRDADAGSRVETSRDPQPPRSSDAIFPE